MTALANFFRDVPLASVLLVLLAVAGLVELFQDDITFQEFGVGLGVGGGGLGAIGGARAYLEANVNPPRKR